MKKHTFLVISIFMVMLTSACTQEGFSHSDSHASHPLNSSTSMESNGIEPTSTPSDMGSTSVYSEIIASFEAEHEGLSQVDLILDEVGYGLTLYFEPMEWDEFDNETRVEIAKSALEYAFIVTEKYTRDVVTYYGYASDGDLIIFNDSSFHIVVMDTDGDNIYGTDIWP